ncbi:hypothetical protein LTR85_006003 [Meristemomyces frigidus]|nr:hypothetical protein LTR85_006003 [Meristemomyces frigidus]
MASNGTAPGTPDLGRPQSASRAWFEPLLIVCLMVGSLIINRRRSYSITRPRKSREASSENLLGWRDPDYDSEESSLRSRSPSPMPQEQQHVCGIPVESPDSNRFANHFHSRILQKYPFLIEMFYWALNYVAYAMTKKMAGVIYGRGGHHVTALAQENGIAILNLEHDSILKIFFPIGEAQLQQFFLNHHKPIMTFFNQIYSLVHIPGTVAFLSWYYYAAPSHSTFAVARRTMTLGNFSAFIIFCFYPCMPPRLLPDSFGFQDTVRQGNAESVWVGGANVNQLAAMPSLHFTYAFVIGCTFFYHSGFLQLLQGQRTPGRSTLKMVGFMLMGILYPMLVLTVIVATANHYYFDAVVATASVTLAFLCNRIWLIFLPAEQVLCWVLRLKKPVPTTGQRYGTGEEETKERVKVTIV